MEVPVHILRHHNQAASAASEAASGSPGAVVADRHILVHLPWEVLDRRRMLASLFENWESEAKTGASEARTADGAEVDLFATYGQNRDTEQLLVEVGTSVSYRRNRSHEQKTAPEVGAGSAMAPTSKRKTMRPTHWGARGRWDVISGERLQGDGDGTATSAATLKLTSRHRWSLAICTLLLWHRGHTKGPPPRGLIW